MYDMAENLCLECIPTASDPRNFMETRFCIRGARLTGLTDFKECTKNVVGFRKGEVHVFAEVSVIVMRISIAPATRGVLHESRGRARRRVKRKGKSKSKSLNPCKA